MAEEFPGEHMGYRVNGKIYQKIKEHIRVSFWNGSSLLAKA